ncbi:MAG: alpha/beta fold hydrolase [Thermoleophilaceae bacterium]
MEATRASGDDHVRRPAAYETMGGVGVDDLLREHRAAGRAFEADGVGSFVREQGEGAPVVLMHGVPASSFLYRKVLGELAARGVRGIAFDLPGLGLADRPEDFDYSWSGLARWTAAAIDALEVDRCHLVVHDIAGPIGFEWAIRHPDRVLSLTALDTIVDVGEFRRPWPMHPFSIRGIGEAWLAAMRPPASRWIFRWETLADGSAMTDAEIDAYVELLRREDGGRAFLRVMRGFELTDAKQRFLYDGLAERPYPAQVVWARGDRALGDRRRHAVHAAHGVDEPVMLPGGHILQEEHAPAVAAAIAGFATGAPREP